MAYILHPNGIPHTIAPPEGSTTLTLAQLQEAVGGDIEIIVLPDGRRMVLNEEGKLTTPTRPALPINWPATRLSGRAPHDVIVGPVVIATYAELEGEEDEE